jgi:hypothetical protein
VVYVIYFSKEKGRQEKVENKRHRKGKKSKRVSQFISLNTKKKRKNETKYPLLK